MTTRIKCPKCKHHTMRKSHGKNMIGREYFCDREHLYFGTWELVNFWGYDVGDFVSPKGECIFKVDSSHKIYIIKERKHPTSTKFILPPWFNSDEIGILTEEEFLFQFWDEDTVSIGEPEWKSGSERIDAYNFLFECEFEDMKDFMDLRSTQNDALQIGLQ